MADAKMLISDWWLKTFNGRNRQGRNLVRGIARSREKRQWKEAERDW